MLKNFLSFDKMITPNIVSILYWLLLLVVLFSSLGAMFFAISPYGGPSFGLSFGSFVRGIIIFIIGTLSVRIYCEIIMIFFKIHETLKNIEKK